MDDTSDTCWSWPHWKFGLKRDDLFQSLHLQYNTVSNPILDPEAFHHDVYELSHQAATADEFHRLLGDRKQQRLRELNESLESAAFEIVANPSLIGTEQWQHAVQLFRTKSLDSLVRYFASYLPSDHARYRSADSSSNSDAGSSVDSITDSHGSMFDCDTPTMTDEPFEFATSIKELMPPSPRSMTMCSGASSVRSHDDDDLPPLSPTRTLSISESEPDCCATPGPHASHGCEGASNTRAGPRPAAPKSFGVDNTSTIAHHVEPHNEEGKLALASPDIPESDSPTPRVEVQAATFLEDTKASLPPRRYRSLSPSRPHPISEHDLDHVLSAHRHHEPRSAQRSRFRKEKERERECSPAVPRRRRSPIEAATHRIHKPLPDTASGRSRPRGRRLGGVTGERES